MGTAGGKRKSDRSGLPRVLLAAPASQSGKTVITCALLAALRKRGLSPAAFKCGPDYIDPMFHREVLGIDSRNLDSWFSGGRQIRRQLSEADGDCAVLEGVMGIYDGADPGGLRASSYEIACETATPVLLIVDAKGAGRTILSLIRGILEDDTEHLIRGILLNRISTGYYGMLRPVLAEGLERAGFGVSLLGFVPVSAEMELGSRHLGLLLPQEIDGIRGRIERAACLLEEHADLDGILEIMRSAPLIPASPASRRKDPPAEDPLTLAVARDSAFCFYYQDNLEQFARRGVRIRFFSPLADSEVPEDADGLLLGGGYPELHLRELSGNTSMLDSVRKSIDGGLPSLAECGGFMFLHERIVNEKGEAYPMAGVVAGECRYTGQLVRFGYMELLASSETDPLSGAFAGMKGHEFHYYDSTCNGDSFLAGKPFREKQWTCMMAGKDHLWGFPHLYYGSREEAVDAFVEEMRNYHDGKLQKLLCQQKL
ncbi:MAG: cobyrinate a,c-diamide synthase [Lachnospiraceae bacterium]|nr:cobyrinate a,c-diamide synthase [Lachnospiraceae bacterium]